MFDNLDSNLEDASEATTIEPLSKSRMDNPDLAEEFPSFTAPPWTSAADDPNMLAQPQEQVIQTNWEEWMQWDQKTTSEPVEFQNTPDLVSACGDSSSQTDTLSSKEHSQSPDALLRPIPEALGGNTFNFDPSFPTNASFDMSAAAFPSPPEIKDIAPTDTFLDTTGPWEQHSRAHQLPQLGLDLALIPNSNPPLPTPSTDRSSQSPAKHTAIGSDSSPEPTSSSANFRKRKVSDDEEEDSGVTKQGPVKKTAHNMIEKRYRTNLNDKIAALRDSVPSLRVMSRPNGTLEDDDPEDLEGLTPAHKLNKATVLSKATEYIRHLEKRNKKLNEELLDYKNRLEAMGKMAMSGPPMLHSMMSMPDSTIRYQEDAFSTTSSHSHVTKPIGPPQGLIPVPESMANLHRRHPNQPHYAHSHSQYASFAQPPQRQGLPNQQPMVHSRGGNGMMNKIMIGSFAGLMVLDGFSQRSQTSEDTESKALFAIPMHLLRELFGPSLSSLLGPSQHLNLLPFIKFLLVAMAFASLAGPLLSFRPKSKKVTIPAARVTPGLSLASPIELRKQAWLTAVQSVWVPRHSLVLELAALALKILKLSTRKMIGWQGYALITGATKEQEEGRVKAWSIAWDAQLTGGDSEINVLRLILTLMASGTLPDTPARLMLKALHIRILLWEVANSGYGQWYKFEAISAKLSRKYWNHARAEHRIASNQKDTEGNRLPPHLATLVEIHSDEVLVHPIIQRAYNLAWNKPSAENTNADASLDTVVEDFAISSPLDALAAWWSSLKLNRALTSYLAEDKSWTGDLDLAVSVAPPNSGAHIRALVAKAILTDNDREQTIAAAFNAIPSKLQDRTDISRGSGLMNVVGNSPVPSDVIKTLTLARCLSLVEMSRSSGSKEARLRATYPIATINTTEYAFSLLSFVAAFRILDIFSNDSALLDSCKGGLEHLASSLRLWVGHERGRKSGLSAETRGLVVEKCLHISKALTGMIDAAESDDGYVSGDDMTPSPVIVEAAE